MNFEDYVSKEIFFPTHYTFQRNLGLKISHQKMSHRKGGKKSAKKVSHII
jgi:hypothetical protein